jgi:RNA polymerase sigma-70 factor (sigma-E family)
VTVSQTEEYAALVAARAPALLRLAVMLTGDRAGAEDLLQSTLVHTQKHADRIAAMAAPASYLRRALVHEHISAVRRLQRRVRTAPLDGHDLGVDDDTGAVERRDLTWRLLATLPRQQRAVLVLRFYEDLPDREIAEALGCGESTVRSHASRALAALRAYLDDTEEVLP